MKEAFIRYLSVKKSIDDRALHRRVWESLKDRLKNRGKTGPVRVLEVGCGIGTMFQRALEWGLLDQAAYLGIDPDRGSIETARRLIPAWAEEERWNAREGGLEQQVQETPPGVSYVFVEADLFDFLSQSRWQSRFDLVIANALLDLVDLNRALPLLRNSLKPQGLGYFSINYDGMTAFEPVIEAELDELIIRLYHQSMEERLVHGQPSGGSRAGRRLFTALPQAGFEILDAGASDWVVFPRSGRYTADEKAFLHSILDFFEEALRPYTQVDPTAFQHWLIARRSQIEEGNLVFLAHQFDFLTQAR